MRAAPATFTSWRVKQPGIGVLAPQFGPTGPNGHSASMLARILARPDSENGRRGKGGGLGPCNGGFRLPPQSRARSQLLRLTT